MQSVPRLVLGSGSPRRLELLRQIGVSPDEIERPNINEQPDISERPLPYCIRIAREKALAVNALADDIVLSADTTVAVGNKILGKAENISQAEEFLLALSGRRHKVITAVVVRRNNCIRERAVAAVVKMKRLSDRELETYLNSGEWNGKAGAYGIQGMAGAFIPWLRGSFTAVVGLPLAETTGLLLAAGYPLYRGDK